MQIKRTFNLPNFDNGMPLAMMSTVEGLGNANMSASLPKITGQFRACAYNTNFEGAFSDGNSTMNEPAQAKWIGTGRLFKFDAANSSAVYSRTDNKVFGNRNGVKFIIKI